MIDKRHFSIVIILFNLLVSCYAAISTELVEGYGCYDSEFKLTCNELDSTIGILEATFTPHCESNNGNQKCLYYDEDRKTEAHEEEYAARKLLDVLRNARLKEREREETEARTEEYRSELPYSTDVYDPSTINDSAENISAMDYDVLMRSDKRYLRDSLERLISLYLTKLREDSIEYNFEDNHIRERRDLNIKNSHSKVNRRKKLVPGKCTIMRRRIGTLDKIEIEHALRNLTNTEFNIRKLLNYRCSGKNHCSFIFSNDHPYATFWNEGTIYVKYICMENFRFNKYCGELLQVGNEDWDLRKNINWTEMVKTRNENEDDVDNELNGPRTEALRQHEMNFYQVKSVKIIKTDENVNENSSSPSSSSSSSSSQSILPKPKANSSEIKLSVKQLEKEKDKAKNKVYSQDFIALKILPNVVEKIEPDIEKLKKEEYLFKKQKEEDESIKHNVDSAIETNEIDSVLITSTSKMKPLTTKVTSNIIAPTSHVFTTTTANRNDEQTTMTQKVKIATTIMTETEEDYDITENKDFEKSVTTMKPHAITTTTTTTTATNNDTDLENFDINSTAFSNYNIDSPEKEKYGHDEEGSGENIEYYDSMEDKETKESKVLYKFKQHTLPSSTLLHGFIANPGYPSYYIGSQRDCKWKIIIAKGQKMSLTLLDLHLRMDEYCKDSLEIIDFESKKSLYRGCHELTRPVKIESSSHQVEIVLKTKSKNIYPKRGFLIHYKAIGCIVPQVPENVKIVSQLENLLRFNCEANHVFPDTTQSERTLICINENWNDTLTKCVAIHETLGRQINLVNEQLRRESRMGSEPDTLNDILVPIFIISGLFILNAIVFIIILRYRKQRRQESLDHELANL